VRWIAVLMALLPVVALAAEETVYITDELRLGLYDGEQTTGRPFQTLISGAKLEVLERALMTVRVRTEDGVEGWVKTAYLVPEEPARRRVEAVERENAAMMGQLDALRTAEGVNAKKIAGLETELANARQSISALPELEQRNTELRATLDAAGSNVAMHWLIAATIAAFIVGALIGYLWLDRRVRRQFGGLRVY
jgi:hypothetical protein